MEWFNMETYLTVVFTIAAVARTLMILGYRTSEVPVIGMHALYQLLAIGCAWDAFGIWIALCVTGVMGYLNCMVSFAIKQRSVNCDQR